MNKKILIGVAVALPVALFSVLGFSGPPTPSLPPSGVSPQATTPQPSIPKPTFADGAYVTQAATVNVPASGASVAKLALPAGSYVLTAKIVGSNETQEQRALACGFTTGGTWDPNLTPNMDYSSVTIAPQSRLPMTLLQTFAVVQSANVTVQCRASEGTSVTARWVKFVATPVSKINVGGQ